MDPEVFEHHLTSPQGRGHVPAGAFTITAEGGVCGDTVRFSLATDGRTVTDAGFTAHGCGTTTAAASATVGLVVGAGLLEVARIGAQQIADELGGLSPGKFHAAEVVADGLARALGQAAYRAGALESGKSAGEGSAGEGSAGEGSAGEGSAAGGSGGEVPRTLVAMSSGVDSTVAALLCAAESETVAVTLELWADTESDSERSCCSSSAVAQARKLAHDLGLPHFTLDLRDEFRKGVVEPFIDGYRRGETPNPCVRCNGHVRLDAMLSLADRLGCATLATGHYARVDTGAGDDAGAGPDEPPLLRAAADPAKDQTYMLAALAPDSLRRMRFPLGDFTKPEVREIAARHQLPVAAKADSQDLCFLVGTDRGRFLQKHGGIEPQPGELVDSDGTVIGSHDGHELFTVGQRRGFDARRASDSHQPKTQAPDRGPLYVVEKDAASNRVVVGPKSQLETDRVRVRGARLHRDGARVDRVKLRYRTAPFAAHLTDERGPGNHKELMLELEQPVTGAAPGQLACLMDGELIVGWGTIAKL
jgi:tRNA-uridine 2-sulfurtransferase